MSNKEELDEAIEDAQNMLRNLLGDESYLTLLLSIFYMYGEVRK